MFDSADSVVQADPAAIKSSVAPHLQPIRVPVRDQAPGWLYVDEYYSLVEHPLYPRNKEVTQAIQVFDPEVIPFGVYTVFQSPYEDAGHFRQKIFYRHALGAYLWNPHDEVDDELQGIHVPHNWKGPVPNKVLRVLDEGPGPDPKEEHDDFSLPGPFEPWDWQLYYKLRFIFTKDPDDLIEGQARAEEKLEKSKQHNREAFNYQMKDLQKWTTKFLEQKSDVEIMEYFNSLGKVKKPVKPFIHLGS